MTDASPTRLLTALQHTAAALREFGHSFALVGGLAVSIRVDPLVDPSPDERGRRGLAGHIAGLKRRPSALHELDRHRAVRQVDRERSAFDQDHEIGAFVRRAILCYNPRHGQEIKEGKTVAGKKDQGEGRGAASREAGKAVVVC